MTFVLPAAYFSGGARMVFEYAGRLKALGHSTSVVFPMLPYRFRDSTRPFSGLRSWLGGLKNNLLYGPRPPRQPTWGEVVMVPMIADPFLPDADAVVATAWPTAYSVFRLSAAKGAKCYLVQHREIDTGLPRAVDGTYRLPLFRIAGSDYTARLLREMVGVEAYAVVPNGVDVAFWSGCPEPRPERSGVLMPHAPLGGTRKGAADGIAALEKVHRERPDLPLRCFGRRRTREVPAFVEYFENPDDDALRRIYSGAAVFLFPSRYEGYGLPPLEAMAGGCPVVATRVGAVPDFCVDGVSGLLVAPGDVEGMARALLALLKNKERRVRMGEECRARAGAFDLALATREFERALGRAVHDSGAGRYPN